jgi:hypothetical protein
MIRHSASTVNRSSHPPGRAPFLVFPGGGDCFCLRYLLSDESWRIELTQKAMEMDFCVVFCANGVRVLGVWSSSLISKIWRTVMNSGHWLVQFKVCILRLHDDSEIAYISSFLDLMIDKFLANIFHFCSHFCKIL